jgi:hypothetical protein
MRSFARRFLAATAKAFRDPAPLALVVTFFQLVALCRPFPNLGKVLVGLAFVVLGLALFLRDLILRHAAARPEALF